MSGLVTAVNLHTAYTLSRLGTRYHDVVHLLLLRQIAPCGMAVAWLLYWHFSRRVRNTYGSGVPVSAPPLLQ